METRERSGIVLDQIRNEFGKIATYLVSSQNPMSAADKVGLVFTIIAMTVILTPIAMSDSDPYRLQAILEEVKNLVPSADYSENNSQESQYRVIAYLKLSPEFHLETTERIMLGKINSKTL